MGQRDLRIEYLRWVKDLHRKLHQADALSTHYDLSGSSVYEPTGILLQHLKQHVCAGASVPVDHVEGRFIGLENRLREPNPWGQEKLMAQIAGTWGVDTDRVLLTTGASDAVFLTCQALIEAGDHVIVETPVYEPLLAVPTYLGAEVSFLERCAAHNYVLDPDRLEELLRPNTKLVVLSNLHNPSGTLSLEETLREIASRVRASSAKILVDEISLDFVEPRQRSAAALDDVFISVGSLSKAFGLSVLRCGWILAEPGLTERIREVYVMIENIGSRFIEALSSIVFENLYQYRSHRDAIISRNRVILERFAEPMQRDGLITGTVPTHGCIYFPQVNHIAGKDDMQRFIRYLEGNYQVFVTPGTFFGAPSHIRVGFGGDSEALEMGLQRLAEALRASR